jgi:hypothetical protein
MSIVDLTHSQHQLFCNRINDFNSERYQEYTYDMPPPVPVLVPTLNVVEQAAARRYFDTVPGEFVVVEAASRFGGAGRFFYVRIGTNTYYITANSNLSHIYSVTEPIV